MNTFELFYPRISYQYKIQLFINKLVKKKNRTKLASLRKLVVHSYDLVFEKKLYLYCLKYFKM